MTELYFFYGTLCHEPLLAAVLGAPKPLQPARLDGHEVRHALDADGTDLGYPLLVEGPAGTTGGIAQISEAEAELLDWYEIGYRKEQRSVTDAEGTAHQAWVYIPDTARWGVGDLWTLEAWAAEKGPLATLAVAEVIALRGQVPMEQALARYPMIRVRAASRLRATEAPRPAKLRFQPGPEDIEIESLRTPYAKFFAVEDYRLRHRRFDGTMTQPLERAAFVSGDATVVLPYDPIRDRVLLVEQFRTGPLARGDVNPWSLEAIAGRVDAGETPEEAARREAGEEAGITLGRLIAAPNHYPSPGAKSEYIYCFIGLCDIPDSAPGLGGLEAEGEDIRSHRISFADLMALIESGEVENGPLLVLALWLERMREPLRADALGG
ncbi:nudix-type nucleoside diphosphatase (YffH/AdpP family) [Rhodobacter sp. JA431]|uniref:NUDIX domain-containing protein n=1 Tax=Rhodobacter sp. JA431 TaxID=570013 RepID=UPI000BC80480|nr:NUDIX domain-containing protein [Rhodobacter sp. JA431]SOC13182.1 nudix-type nucleoside diphosphatase (YffH/AdpP family) [Rhodobacter sp. JA431]